MYRANREMRRAYCGPELILYGKLETITAIEVVCLPGQTLLKDGSQPDDVVISGQQQQGQHQVCV